MEPTQGPLKLRTDASTSFRRPPPPSAGLAARSAAPGASAAAARPATTVIGRPTLASTTSTPEPTGVSANRQQLEARRRRSAFWFYWIAGLTLVNTIGALAAQHWRFVVGLGVTQLADGLAARVGRGWNGALAVDLLLIGSFVLLGGLAARGRDWAFLVGLGVYAIDSLVFVLARDWLGVAIHIFVLAMIFKGYQASRRLRVPVA